MEDFKKFSLLKDVQTITSDGTPSMDKQDKTAEDLFCKIYSKLYGEEVDSIYQIQIDTFDGGELLDLCQKYAQHRTAELEAKIKALEERLEAADEVIAYTEKINFYATHGDVKREYDEALEKYQSLKQ